MSFDFFLKIFLKILMFGYTDTDATLSFIPIILYSVCVCVWILYTVMLEPLLTVFSSYCLFTWFY